MAGLLSISHDKITRGLSRGDYGSQYLWKKVKPYVQELTRCVEPIVLSFDGSIEEKPCTDESDLICWHWDHVFNRSVKGANFLTALVEVQGMRLPCAVKFVRKDCWTTDEKTGKAKRTSSKTKNELFRQMVGQCDKNFIFDYVVWYSWNSNVENMGHVKGKLGRDFVAALKSNRKVALCPGINEKQEYVGIETLRPGRQTVGVWLEGLGHPLLLVKQVFKNGDGTVGELYLVCSDLSLSYEQVTTIYKKRWGVEEYHKSIKSNLCFAKSPTKTAKPQSNHFAMKARIYQAALVAAHIELLRLSAPNAA